jgi:hypothetical protein
MMMHRSLAERKCTDDRCAPVILQRELSMGGSMLSQIVEDDQRVLPATAKILGYGEPCEWRDPLQSR